MILNNCFILIEMLSSHNFFGLYGVFFLYLFLLVPSDTTADDLLEQNDHVLFGSRIKVYLSTYQNGFIQYNPTYWTESNQNVVRQKRTLRQSLRYMFSKIVLPQQQLNYQPYSPPNVVYQQPNYQPYSPANVVYQNPALSPLTTQAPDTVYPEVLVVVDYRTYQFYGGNVDAIVRHVIAYYTGIDLWFRPMTQPKIRLNIAGIVIPQDLRACLVTTYGTHVGPTMFENLYNFIQADKSFFHQTYYDLINVMVHKDAVLTSPGALRIAGISTTARACRTTDGAVPLVVTEDSKSYLDFSTAVHEFAHAFGSPHDGFLNNNVRGGLCREQDGFMMAATTIRTDANAENSMVFSHCSIASMRQFLMTPLAACLLNKPTVTPAPGKKILPGKTLSLDDQCSRFMGAGNFYDRSRYVNCKRLYCVRPGFLPLSPNMPPAQGSFCNTNHICLNGNCVPDPQ